MIWAAFGKSNLGDILESFLKVYNIQTIDFFIVTHLHSDHINGLFKLEDKLLENKIKIESVIYSIPKYEDTTLVSNYTENSISFMEFENFLNKFKIKQIIIQKFDKIILNKNLSIDILNPEDDKVIVSKDNVNSNSIIAMISIKNSNFLFMGDSTIESEEVMINSIFDLKNAETYLSKLNNIVAIQIGHHGSNTSTSEYLLKNLKTKFAIISCKKSVYGHPSKTVLDILKKYNIKFLITQEKRRYINKILNLKLELLVINFY